MMSVADVGEGRLPFPLLLVYLWLHLHEGPWSPPHGNARTGQFLSARWSFLRCFFLSQIVQDKASCVWVLAIPSRTFSALIYPDNVIWHKVWLIYPVSFSYHPYC